MGKEIKFTQSNSAYGQLNSVMRIIGRYVYYPNNPSPQVMQVISQLAEKGAEITYAKRWIQIDMFKNQSLVKLGNEEFDVSVLSDKEIEEKLYNFYVIQYQKANFNVVGKENIRTTVFLVVLCHTSTLSSPQTWINMAKTHR